jgi:hypothetical protein
MVFMLTVATAYPVLLPLPPLLLMLLLLRVMTQAPAADSLARSAVKGLVWRLFSTTATMGIALLLLHDVLQVRRLILSVAYRQSSLGSGLQV